MTCRANSLFGLRVLEDRNGLTSVPVLQLSPSFEWCSEEFRQETNRWLLDLFGRKEVAYIFDAKAFWFSGVLISPGAIAQLRGMT